MAGRARGGSVARVRVAWSLPEDLVARLDAEADARVVSARRLAELLIAKGLDRLVPVEELVRTRATSTEPPASADSAGHEPTAGPTPSEAP